MAHLILSLWLLVTGLGPRAYGQNAPAQEGRSTPGKRPASSTPLDNSYFTFNLYRQLVASDPGRNVFFSPLSFSIPLTLLALQAKPKARADILHHLGFRVTEVPEDSEKAHKYCSLLLEASLPPAGQCQADSGSMLFLGQRRYPVSKFARRAQTLYRTETFSDFLRSSQVTRQEMDLAMEKKTHGKIKTFFQGVKLPFILLLANYMFFKGKWKYQFDPKVTKIMPFSVSSELMVPVPMMQRLGWFQLQYFRHIRSHVLQMPCACNATAVFVLPDKGKIAKVEEALNKQNFEQWTRTVQPSRRKLYFPKLSLTGNMDLDKLVLPPSSPDLFSYNAGLSGISLQHLPIRLSKAVQRVELVMGEEGTEEEDISSLKRILKHRTSALYFNKPFLLFIFKGGSHNLLFMGKVTNPKAS